MANLFAVPNFITAPSAQALRRRMFLIQQKYQTQFRFFDISFTDGQWYVWYVHVPTTSNDKFDAAKELTKKE